MPIFVVRMHIGVCEMSPRRPTSYLVYSVPSSAVQPCYIASSEPVLNVGYNQPSTRLGYFCGCAFLSAPTGRLREKTFFPRMSRVLLWCYVLKVIESVVFFVRVFVVNLKSVRVSEERMSDESMNEVCALPTAPYSVDVWKPDRKVTSPDAGRGKKLGAVSAPTYQRADSSKRRNLVHALKTNNWPKLFHDYSNETECKRREYTLSNKGQENVLSLTGIALRAGLFVRQF